MQTIQLNTNNTHLTHTSELSDIINSFIADRNVNKNSKKLYRRTLRQFFAWIKENNYQLNDIARSHILEYQNSLLDRKLTALTVGSYLTVVKLFFEWTNDNLIYKNVAKNIKAPTRKNGFIKQPLTPGQTTDLLEHLQTTNKRDYAIINLIVRTGLRTIEVHRANVEDIKMRGSQRILEIQGKGHNDKNNFVMLTPKAYKPIEDYLNARGVKDNTEPLFTSKSNRTRSARLATRSISRIAKEGLQAIGLDENIYTAHSLRHTAGTNILIATQGNYKMAQQTLRHANPATTQLYTSTYEDTLRLEHGGGEQVLDTLY